ncbi:hypothetical protein DPMN_024071 [Dreissena polymorpha]|uniref:Uncharacterized protein n=1 Tax=Dreissena polymorpha TaxID=45954 RepID=A0A9D4LMA6_DREPO|nr:hypothetical protein DPMN_024071 [Dreissena polymorpha]
MKIVCYLLAGTKWLRFVPVMDTIAVLAYVTYQTFRRGKVPPSDLGVNLRILKESSMVVNMVDIEDLGDKVSFCRCLRSNR